MFDVESFIANIGTNKGLATGNRYAVNINANVSGGKNPHVDLYAESISIPSRSIATEDIRTYGPLRKVARESIYGEMTIGFIVTNDMLVKDYFDRWMVTVQNDHSYDVNYYDKYVGDIYIAHLSEDDEYVIPSNSSQGNHYAVKVEEAYPITIGELNYGYANMNQYMKLSVTFTYRRWINLKYMDGGSGKPLDSALYRN